MRRAPKPAVGLWLVPALLVLGLSMARCGLAQELPDPEKEKQKPARPAGREVPAGVGQERPQAVTGADGTPTGAQERAAGVAWERTGKESPVDAESAPLADAKKWKKSEEEWKQLLTAQQYHVCREKGTERAFTGDYWQTKTAGTYRCSCCGLPLFSSQAKFDSGTGWPSFGQPVQERFVKKDTDRKLGYPRTEVLCARCGAHLGHVFEDGPRPTGLRYCINSVCLKLEADKEEKESSGAKDKPAKEP